VYRWLVFEQTDVIPAVAGLRFRLQTGRIEPDGREAQTRRAAGEELLGFLDDHLGGREWVAGERYSVADIALYGYLHVAHAAGYDVPALHERPRAVPAERPARSGPLGLRRYRRIGSSCLGTMQPGGLR
jgi:glutathione S-transferase